MLANEAINVLEVNNSKIQQTKGGRGEGQGNDPKDNSDKMQQTKDGEGLTSAKEGGGNQLDDNSSDAQAQEEG